MRKKILLICDQDRSYVERFAAYAEKREGLPFQIRFFTDAQSLDIYLEEREADLILAGEGTQKWREEKKEFSCPVLPLVKERRGETGPSLYQYQSVEAILRQALAFLERQQKEKGEKPHSRIFGVYSPIKRCYKTTFSLVLGQILAEKDATLYVNLEDISGLSYYLSQGEGGTLSDLLYQRETGKKEMGLYQMVRSVGKLTYLPPVSCPEDIREAHMDELTSIVKELASLNLYSYLVIDVGDALVDPLPVLSLCHRIYMPVRDDHLSRAKVESWWEYFRERTEEEVMGRIRHLSIPRYARLESGQIDYVGLRFSPFGQYVEAQLREEEEWQ